MATQNDSSSIHDILELFKYLKTTNSDLKQRDLSTLSFSSKNYQSSNRHALDSISIQNINQGQSRVNNNWIFMHQYKSGKNDGKNVYVESQFHSNKQNPNTNKDIFNKLYKDGKDSQMKKCILEYQTRRSKELKQKDQCTFSPNIKSRFKTDHQRFDSVQNDAFYNRNMQWMERKDNHIRKLQCQKNLQSASELTFTPRINKNISFKRKDMDKNQSSLQDIHKSKECKVAHNKGVNDFLQRQQKAKRNNEYVNNKKKYPYSHIWNIKRGQFSYAK